MQMAVAVPRGEHCKPDVVNQLPKVGSGFDGICECVWRMGHGEYLQSKWQRQHLTSPGFEGLPLG